ncbi:MAG: hypothetical protein LUF02_00555 [Erysipelotrichaceae bacterium]|nr:hypothetical protein [Erysipelotrichaceae bacterium]
MKKKLKKIVIVVISICIFVSTFFFLQELLQPKYMTSVFEGNLTGDYYDNEHDNDVIFIGDCEVYENISPIAIWENYGIKSYIRGNAQQLAWHSYYILEDTLKYETPKVIVYNVTALHYGEPQNEAYNRMVLDDMPLSLTKINAILASMTEEESLLSYIFPILRYHSRWSELTSDDFYYLLNEEKQTNHNGYLMNAGVKAMTTEPSKQILSDYTLPETSMEYLDKMRQLCEDNGIEFVLMKSSSIYPVWYDEWDEQIVEYANEHDLIYINCMDNEEEGIDMSTDTYDGGLHLNVYGAEKEGSYIASILKEAYDLEDHRDNEEDVAVWNKKIEAYNAMLEDQLYELEEYGYLKSYGGTDPNETEEEE